ncbi:vesicle transport V-SNARE protein vti1 [Trichodelitschia bisporula]|uniref:Vesicle transport V-SNARE protein vti1 n=1 Tax=Trichodelitschia bisporula TaxID=703511 RepID=A0A6G1IAZ0_9PEZI|nr:vesicle transport V-SNARE protein vti1 [Trichodelitschia bisporula]
MTDILDTEAGSELFASYEAEFKLVQAELNQKLEQIPELTGEPRKAALSQAERSVDEAKEILDQMRLEKANIPTATRPAINTRFRNYSTDLDSVVRKLASLASAPRYGRYSDNPDAASDPNLEQRQQLLSGTERLERSSGRLRDSHRIALETEEIGRNTLADLGRQRETIEHTHTTLLESESYTDRSIKTLRGMARR